MAERIGDESIYMCINELKKGKIQFTDATNCIFHLESSTCP